MKLTRKNVEAIARRVSKTPGARFPAFLERADGSFVSAMPLLQGMTAADYLAAFGQLTAHERAEQLAKKTRSVLDRYQIAPDRTAHARAEQIARTVTR